MPWILFRHFLVELTKVLFLTTAIIVVVVAFGAVIKPLTGNLLGPGGILKYIFLAMVPMLQYALPFAAGFAATIVTHRFASDNEIQAMSVSGISYRVILLPQIVLGIVLTIFMFFLVQTLIPRFLGKMDDVIAHDAAEVFVNTIRSGESFSAGSYLISADRVALVEDFPDSSLQRVRMEGVVAIEIDGNGRLITEFVARSGSADLYSSQSDLIVKVAFRDATIMRPGESTLAFAKLIEPVPNVIPVGWERSPKYLPWSELLAVYRDPSKGALVEDVRRKHQPSIAAAILMDQLGKQIAATGTGLLVSEEADRSYEIRDAMLGGTGLIPVPPTKKITLIERQGTLALREASAVGAQLLATADSALSPHSNRLDLIVPEAKARDLRSSGDRTVRWPTRIVGLAVGSGTVEHVPSLQESIEQARSIAAQTTPPLNAYSAAATTFIARIEMGIFDTKHEALSHLAMRFAQPISVALMLLLGGILAIWRRDSLPLTVFLLAFLPALANVLMIASGQGILRSGKVATGLTVMWMGSLIFLVLIVGIGRRMARR